MNFNVINNSSYVNVEVKSNLDGSVTIVVNDKPNIKPLLDVKPTGKPLLEYKPGEIVALGAYEYAVLYHAHGTTGLVTKDIVEIMSFGTSKDYGASYVRSYCNDKFYNGLVKVVGADNILPHTVNLRSDDGAIDDVVCEDNVSILTMANYRRYRELIPADSEGFWLATPVTDINYDNHVYWVFNGNLQKTQCNSFCGVRPFCILKSSVLVF